MTAAPSRASACVDCGMALLGSQPRCPRCHDRHATRLAADIASDVSPTVPFSRRDPRVSAHPFRVPSGSAILARWALFAEAFVILILGLFLLFRGCA